MKFKTLFLIFIVSLLSLAIASDIPVNPPIGEIIKLRGSATFENKELKIGDKIFDKGFLETKEKTFVQIKIDKWKSNISVGANSKMEINLAEEKKYTLDEGACRWKSFAKSEFKGKINTKRASFGVRGTDFLLTSNSLLGETEIIMFDGEVTFENINDKNNTAILKKGQWGGIGGRFGERIAPVLDLPTAILEQAEKKIE